MAQEVKGFGNIEEGKSTQETQDGVSAFESTENKQTLAYFESLPNCLVELSPWSSLILGMVPFLYPCLKKNIPPRYSSGEEKNESSKILKWS